MTTTALATETAQKAAPMATGGALAAFIPQDSQQLIRLADVLAKSGDMVPKAFQGNPPAIAAAIMRGMEIGLNPMQALSSIAVINGRATLWGDALPALVQRSGHHIDVQYEGAGDALVAVATLTRGDTGKQVVRRFGIADAKRAGLAGKPGPWQQYPQRMIMHRARGWAIRDGAADALMGLQVSEEVSDYGPDGARDVTPTVPRKGGVVYADPDHPVAPVDEIHEAEAEVVEVTHWTDTAPDSAFPGSAEWDAGVAAFRAGDAARSCTHDEGTQEAADWCGGYHGARRAAE
jgi:hypothetical protein